MQPSDMADRESVGWQYASPDRLQTRVAIWGPGPEGVSPHELVRDAIVSLRPRKVLEIGCGTGDLAAEVLGLLPGCRYLATDSSAGMVASARANGVDAAQVDATALPYADSTYDVVVAAWMLYHVPDLDATLREVARVLGPVGTFLAVTNGDRHLETLLRDAGGEALVTQFSSENGEQVLRGLFRVVAPRRRDEGLLPGSRRCCRDARQFRRLTGGRAAAMVRGIP